MKKILSVLVLFSVVVASVFAQGNDLQPLATIKSGSKPETITLKQLKKRVDVYKLQMRVSSFTVEQKQEILDTLIDERLVIAAAQKMGFAVTDSQVNEFFLQSLAQIAGGPISEEDFRTQIKQQTGKDFDTYFKEQLGMTVPEYKAQMKDQLIIQQYIASKSGNEIQTSVATDEEVSAWYELNKTSIVQSDMLKLFLVVVPTVEDKANAKAFAQQIFNDLKDKKQSMAQIKAKVNSSKFPYQAGEVIVNKNQQAAVQLGIDYQSLIELFNKKKGFFSEFNVTESDCQFYTILDKYDAKMLTLDDELILPDTSTVKVYDYIKANLTQQKQALKFQEVAEKVTKELRKPDAYQMVKSGDALKKLLENW